VTDAPFLNERYEILEPLGSGGMATVYRCRDKESGAVRAIKVLQQRLAHTTEVLKRFENEAAAMDRLSHPHIVPLHDVSFDTEQKFIVMDFIDGESLLDRMERKGLSPKEAVSLIIPVLDALQTAHENGIVHRDIKPHNILISRSNHVFVSDFGIARCVDETDMSITRTGMVMGTWAFMAPEQRADAKGVDRLADIYSVGATLFAAVTGQTPKDLFAAELDPGIYKGVPKTIEAVIRRACAYWTSDRYPTAMAMKADLELTLGMLESGKDRNGPRDVSFVDDPPAIPAEPIETSRPVVRQAVRGSHRGIRPAPLPKRSGRGAQVGLAVGIIVLVGLMGWMFLNTMNRVGESSTASDLTIEVELPKVKRKGRIGQDNLGEVEAFVPVLTHTPHVPVPMGDDLPIEVTIEGSKAYDKVQAWYRPVGQTEWNKTRLRRVGGGYLGSIPMTRIFSEGVEYWIEATPYTGGLPSLVHGSKGKPVRILIETN